MPPMWLQEACSLLVVILSIIKTSNSSMKLLLTPWTIFKLSNINKADNMEVEDLSDNGVEVFSNNISMNDP